MRWSLMNREFYCFSNVAHFLRRIFTFFRWSRFHQGSWLCVDTSHVSFTHSPRDAHFRNNSLIFIRFSGIYRNNACIVITTARSITSIIIIITVIIALRLNRHLIVYILFGTLLSAEFPFRIPLACHRVLFLFEQCERGPRLQLRGELSLSLARAPNFHGPKTFPMVRKINPIPRIQ